MASAPSAGVSSWAKGMRTTQSEITMASRGAMTAPVARTTPAKMKATPKGMKPHRAMALICRAIGMVPLSSGRKMRRISGSAR